MFRFTMLMATAATLFVAPAALAKERPDQPKQKKICRTIEVSGRVTPQRICRKVERPATGEQGRRDESKPNEAADEGK